MVVKRPLRFCATKHGVGVGLRCLPSNLVELRVHSGTVLEEKSRCRFVEQSKRSLDKFVHPGDILTTPNDLCIVRSKFMGRDGQCVFGCEILESSDKAVEWSDFSPVQPLHPSGGFLEGSNYITKAVPENAVNFLISPECALKILGVMQTKLKALEAEVRRKGIQWDVDIVNETDPLESQIDGDRSKLEMSSNVKQKDEKLSVPKEPEFIELKEIIPEFGIEEIRADNSEDEYDDAYVALDGPATEHSKRILGAMENPLPEARPFRPGKVVQKPADGFVITLNPDTLKQDTINSKVQDVAEVSVGIKRGIFEAAPYMANAHVRTGTTQSIMDLRESGAVGSKTSAFESQKNVVVSNRRESVDGLKGQEFVKKFELVPNKVKPNSRFSIDGVRELGIVGDAIAGHEFLEKKHSRLPTTESIKELSGRDYVSNLTNIFENNNG